MIEGADKDACKAKKIDGGGVRTSKSGQSAARTSSKINHQTFTKLRNSISKFIGKMKLKMGRLRSILCEILPSFAADLRPSKHQLRSEFPPRDSQARFSKRKISSACLSQKFLNRLGLRRSDAGYVLILVIAALPVLLFGAKYVLDQQTLSGRRATGTEYVKDASLGSQRLVKQCAQEAALEVAKHWNPGLTLYQQREAMLRIADEVYNAAPTYVDSTVIRAVHGLDVARESTTQGRTYEPIKITRTSDERLSPSLRTVEYREEENKWIRCSGEAITSLRSPRIFTMFNLFYNFDDRDSALVLEDTLRNYSICHLVDNEGGHNYTKAAVRTTTRTQINKSNIPYSGFADTVLTDNASTKIYKRKNPDDDKVKIEIENDKIKVTTDKNYVGYAVPALCNVDIVLGIPVNIAASNASNLDNNTPTVGKPYTNSSEMPTNDAKETPIYQIGQAFHNFVKKFHYTRGVNVGIVPYCGMVSLPLDRINTWARDPENFDRTVFPGNQNEKDFGYIRPCMFYGLFGDYLENLSEFKPNNGIDTFSLTNVMVPQGIVKKVPEYGDNLIYYGDILSTNDPTGDVTTQNGYWYSPKFMRRPVYKIPGLAGKFNFLKMGFESTSGANWSWCNPYHIVEMQSDLLKITDLLLLFYPFIFYTNGLSNFIFVPFVWANNLFQSWSKDPKYDAADTTQATPSAMTNANSGRLSTPSKTTAGRKKALILVVNKPDWFEPGELTYLGFDNDYSEIPMIESDCIRGDIDYSDTTKYFADGTKYNTGDNQIDGQPLIAGAKKILKLSTVSGNFVYKSAKGWYETRGANSNSTGSATVKLSFPQKYLVKVVVEPIYSWTKKLSLPAEKIYIKSLKYINDQYMATSTGPHCRLYTSTDGVTWTEKGDICGENSETGECFTFGYNSGNYIHVTNVNAGVRTSSDLSTWSIIKNLKDEGFQRAVGSVTLPDRFLISSTYGYLCYTQDGGQNWTQMGQKLSALNAEESETVQQIPYGNGVMIAHTGSGWVTRSYDMGNTWTEPEQLLADLKHGDGIWEMDYGDGRFVALDKNCWTSESYDGITWSTPTLELLDDKTARCIAYGSEGWVIILYDGNVYRKQGSIRFTNISSNSDHCTQANENYKLLKRQEFFIEPDQISDPSTEGGEYEITFEASNLRLVSAEITNRPYTRVTPTVTRGSGDVFTLNARVPFVITTNRNGTFTYTNPDGIQMTKNTTGGWGYMQVTPETHRYEKTFDDDGNPIYTVTVPFSPDYYDNYQYTSNIGVAEEKSESVNLDPELYWEAEGTKPKVAIGDYLSYQKTDFADSTGPATVDAANGKIYCPIGTVLHVKAVPHGSVTFYDYNNIDLDRITARPVSAPLPGEGDEETRVQNYTESIRSSTTNARTFTITGPTKFHFKGGEEPSKTYNDVSSTCGPHFGHNLSLYKVMYSCSNSRILYANLKDQWIRDYQGEYSRYDVSYTPLILRDGTLAKRNPSPSDEYNPYSAYWTYGGYSGGYYPNNTEPTVFDKIISEYLPNFRDPCCNVDNIQKVNSNKRTGTYYRNGTGDISKDYLFTFYGAKGDCQFWNASSGSKIWLYQIVADGTHSTITDTNSYRSMRWEKFNVNLQLGDMLKFNRQTPDSTDYWIVQTYLKNGMEKELILQNPTPYVANAPYLADSSGVVQDATIWECLQKNGNPSNGTGGIYLVRLPSNLSTQIVAGDYICFNGDGALDVIVAPLPGTIKFHCTNEDKMTHELYKEYNFCIEPSQMKMTESRDGTQWVSFSTTGDVTVTATYEYTNHMKIALTKPSDIIPSVRWEIKGHKREMEFTKSTTNVQGAALKTQGLHFDGTRVYHADTEGSLGHIDCSNDFGKTWQSLGAPEGSWVNFSLTLAPGATALVETGGSICVSYNNWLNFVPTRRIHNYGGSVFYNAFTWSQNESATTKYLSITKDGQIDKSQDGYTWNYCTQLTDLSNGKYCNGLLHVNNKWYACNRDGTNVYLYSSEDGTTWTTQTLTGYGWNNSDYELGLAYGSNIMMLVARSWGIVATSRDFKTFKQRSRSDIGINTNYIRGICYANGNFIIHCKNSSDSAVFYAPFHDGVTKINRDYKYSQDTDQTIGWGYVTTGSTLNVEMTNFTVTSIGGTYVEIVKKYEKAIEYKKIRRPQRSAYLDYSVEPYATYVVEGRENDNSYWTGANGWIYDKTKGFYVNKSGRGGHTQVYFSYPGDYSSLTYSDDVYEMVHLNADGWLTYDNKKAGQYNASGLSRTYTPFKNFVGGTTGGKGQNWNDYNKGKPGSISLMMQTMTIPGNVALWAGASGETLYAYDWQSAPNATYGRVFRTYDATEAVKEVTKSACAKLKSDWKDNLHVYLIKYRKQTQYKNRVTQATEDFDYDYLNACATENSDDYIYDITETDPAAARTQLNQKLQVIADHIKEWAGYTEARNVEG